MTHWLITILMLATHSPSAVANDAVASSASTQAVAAAVVDKPKVSPVDIAWLRGEVGDGAVAYQANNEVFLVELSDGKIQKLGSGMAPEFSPDSSKLAWTTGHRAVGRMRKGDARIYTIADNIHAEAGVHWISNREVVVRYKKGGWHRVTLEGDAEAVPELNKMGFTGRETDVKLHEGVWTYVAGRQWATSEGEKGRIPGRSAPSLSPDGRTVGAVIKGHRQFRYAPVRAEGLKGAVNWKYAAKRNAGFDNHRFSSNAPDWIVCEDERFDMIVVLHIPTQRAARVGEKGKGDLYGDFTVGAGEGDPWPEVEPARDSKTEPAGANASAPGMTWGLSSVSNMC